MKKIKRICWLLLAAMLVAGIAAGVRNYRKPYIPRSLLELMERNPETEDFVKGYPTRVKVQPDLSGYDRGQGVPLFLQWDVQWGYEPYGSDMIAISGCGPTALAMAGFYLTGEEQFSPDQVAAFAEKNDYGSRKNGSKWTLISEGGPQLGLAVQELPLWESTIADELRTGHPVICVVGPGDFTTEGHFLVLTGYEDGMISLNDPNSHKNSERLWSYEELAPQIRNLWAVSCP